MLLAVRRHLARPGGVDLAVYNYVHPPRPELASRGLGQSPEAELARGERREVGTKLQNLAT